ncbi:MAG TPA: MFS transporter [Nitrososphaera sp.]|nr:MFS transporter [Nitrososphaera sp.]
MPLNASTAGLSTIIPIYMLALGGQVREVAIALFLSNLAVTLGAIFWGKLIDAMHWRKTIITVCSAAVAITCASMYFVSSIPALMLLSALVGFFSVGPAPVTNLLVMEKSRKEDWLKTFSWTSLTSAGGLVIAMVAGYLWLMQYDAQSYALVCSVIAAASLALTVMFVKDPPMTLERRAIAMSPAALVDRLKQAPVMFLKPVSDFSLAKLRASMSRKEFLFFAGTGLYFLSGNLLFTPYTPFLKDSGITDSEVFLAYTILHMSKVIFLTFNHRLVAMGGEEGMGRLSYIPRMFGIVLAVVAAFLFVSNPASVLMMTLVAFIAVDVGFSIWSTTTTSSLLKMIPNGRAGSVLGVNSAIIGAGLLIGSIAAGEVAATFGYGVTFALAIGFLGASFALVSKYFRKAVLKVTA